jgi:hypothetical protein
MCFEESRLHLKESVYLFKISVIVLYLLLVEFLIARYIFAGCFIFRTWIPIHSFLLVITTLFPKDYGYNYR